MKTVDTNGGPRDGEGDPASVRRVRPPRLEQLRRGNRGNRLIWSNRATDNAAPTKVAAQKTSDTSSAVPTWPKTAFRIGFGLIWLVDAVFKWLPDFHKGLLGMVKGAAAGQPGWLHGWFHFWVSTVQANTNLWAYGVAVLETVIALALIFGFARKCTYIVTICSALFIWGIAEGFGGPYSGSSTDIGAAVMYAVVATGLLVLSQYPSGRFSVDYLLMQRISWWHRVAEFGKNNHPAPVEKAPAPVVGPAAVAPPVGGPAATAH